MKTKHVSIFIKELTVGGVQKVMIQLANELAERGHKVDLVVVEGGKGPLSDEVVSSVRTVALDSHRMWWAGAHLIRYLWHSDPDTLLAAGWEVNVIATWAKLFSFKTYRLVLSVHSNITLQSRNSGAWYAPYNPLAVRVFYPVADAIVTVSKGVLSDLSRISSAAAERGRVVYNPVIDQSVLEESQEEVSHPWFAQKNAPPILLGVGRLMPQKNFSLLLRAFTKLCRDREGRLVMLGDGGERANLEALARRLGIQSRVDFVGYVKNPYKYMANASLLVVSSRFEGFGNVLVEALACGCPVVSTDCPSGPREILEGGKWGRLVPVGDEEALAEAIKESLDEENDPEHLRQRAMDFTVEKAVNNYLDVLFPGE